MSENSCREFISDLSDKLRNQFHDDIWNHRCKEIIAMEKTLGISNKNKKTKCTRKLKSRFTDVKSSKAKDSTINNH